MLHTRIESLLNRRLTIAELLISLVVLNLPYLLIGVVWSATHTDHLRAMNGVDGAVSFLGAVASWPVLLIADVCLGSR